MPRRPQELALPPPHSHARTGILRRGFALLGLSIRGEPRPFAAAVGGAFVYAAATIASAVVLGEITDRVIVPSFERGAADRGALALAAAAIIGVAVAKAAGIVVRRVGASLMQFRLHARYRRRVTRQYQQLPLSWHRRHSTGELLSNANADVEAAFWPLAPLPLSVGVLLLLVMTAGALVVTDTGLAAVAFGVGPAMALVNWRYNRAVAQPATRAQQLRADLSGVAHESFDGALVVKTLGREQAETDRFAAVSARLRDELVTMGRIRSTFDPLMEALPQVGVLAVLVVGAFRVDDGALSAGELVRFAYLFTLLAFPIRAIGWVLSELPRAVVGWERVRRVLDAGSRTEQPEGGERIDRPGPARLDVEGVSYRHDPDSAGTPALRDVSLAVPAGKVVAVVGATGSGKSTLASLLVRLADPHAGILRLDGVDLRRLEHGELPRRAALVFQTSFLFDDTVRANIDLGEGYPLERLREATDLAQATEFIEALPSAWDTVVGERGTTLSGGQRQRIALARALVRRPRLLVLDDATSSVDARVEAAILRGLRDADLPSTLVVVAYRRATITLADEVVLLSHGTVRAAGTHTQLLAGEPAYARLLDAYDDSERTERSA